MNICIKKNIAESAFTLAEVLITLAIIGVIAALTIPTLLANKEKQETVTKIKKAYSNLSQAVKFAELENGLNGTWDWGDGSGSLDPAGFFSQYFAPYLRIVKMCTTTAECGYPSSNKFYQSDGAASTTTIINPVTRPACILNDGTFLMVLPVDGSGSVVKTIYVDLNAGLEPNRFGRDVFMFKLDSTKGLVPAGYASSYATVNSNCSITGNGSTCLQKIVMDGWQINSDYPW